MTHEAIRPMSMLALMRMPTIIPEPRLSQLKLTPTPVTVENRFKLRGKVSMRGLNHPATYFVVASMVAPERARADTIERAVRRAADPWESRTIRVSPAATP